MWILLPPSPTFLFWMTICNKVNWFVAKRAGSRRSGGSISQIARAGCSRAISPFSELFWIQERWNVILWNTKYWIQGRWYNLRLTQPLWCLIFWSVLATLQLARTYILKIVLYVLCSYILALLFLALALASLLCCCKRDHEEQICFY